jgi:UDP-N-acetylglucosamine diphosphorylase/glucosamine-1-phosphate N-acetyltransferase
MNVVLFDDEQNRKELLPLTFTRPVSEIRCGILTIAQKWNLFLSAKCSYITAGYLSGKFKYTDSASSIYIAGNVLPDSILAKAVNQLSHGQALVNDNKLIAICGTKEDLANPKTFTEIIYPSNVIRIENVWDIFKKNGEAIAIDFEILTANKKSQPLSNTVTVIGDRNLVFLEKGAKAEACIINTTSGPVYLGENSEIMEGSAIRGPFALCEHSALKLNTKIYGPTTVGPHSKVGGEVNNSVIFGFTNKAHDGFLGNSVLGEWCNLGADTNNSNLKNNYGNVKLFNYNKGKQVDTGLQFCGLIMGDLSKSGINTMFNTGTVVGVGANVYGGDFPPTHIPSFSWGGAQGFETHRLEKLFDTTSRVFERRGLIFDETEKQILRTLFESTQAHRSDFI